MNKMRREQQGKTQLREWIESILPAALIVAVLYAVFWPFLIQGDSMETSFYDGDRIVISRLIARFGKTERGDFIVCRMNYMGKEENVLKRIVGMPGDTVRIDGGGVFINGELLNEDYLDDGFTDGELQLELTADEYFVLGDNRPVSFDSRAAGAISSKNVVGKVLAKWYPAFKSY